MKKTNLILFVFTFFYGINAISQESVNTTGGDISGTGGSVNYSVGQVLYTTSTSSNGSVSQGVQQPYEISSVGGIYSFENITLNMSIQPNPTADFLLLNIENTEFNGLTYVMYDENGKIIQTGGINSSETTISMAPYQPAVYYLNVHSLKNDKIVKSFKIIKN